MNFEGQQFISSWRKYNNHYPFHTHYKNSLKHGIVYGNMSFPSKPLLGAFVLLFSNSS